MRGLSSWAPTLDVLDSLNALGAESRVVAPDPITYWLEIENKPGSDYTLDQVRVVFRTNGRHPLSVVRASKKRPVMLELKQV